MSKLKHEMEMAERKARRRALTPGWFSRSTGGKVPHGKPTLITTSISRGCSVRNWIRLLRHSDIGGVIERHRPSQA